MSCHSSMSLLHVTPPDTTRTHRSATFSYLESANGFFLYTWEKKTETKSNNASNPNWQSWKEIPTSGVRLVFFIAGLKNLGKDVELEQGVLVLTRWLSWDLYASSFSTAALKNKNMSISDVSQQCNALCYVFQYQTASTYLYMNNM